MDMNWLIPVIAALMVYACIYYYLKTKKVLPHVIDFMGPCILIKTERVGIFDTLARPKKLLYAYASAGVILTILCGLCVTVMFLVSGLLSLTVPTEPIPPQDLLLIPGVNSYVPSTFAVWFSLVFAMVIHEAGHGIISRVEHMRVKATGLLTLIIPIGAFVESYGEDVENARLGSKLRMFAAGITNNIVIGTVCLVLLAALLGLAVPGDHPYVYGVYSGYPAEEAGVPPGLIVTDIDGYAVYSLDDITAALAKTRPGQTVTLSGEYKGEAQSYDIMLAAVPDDLQSTITAADSDAGYLGISFMEPESLAGAVDMLTHPASFAEAVGSFMTFLVLPLSSIMGMDVLSFIAADTPDPAILAAPFFGYWGLVHLLFWCAWLNLLLGIFNALPLGGLDGGQMLRESLRHLCRKVGWKETRAYQICGMVTYLLILIVILQIIMPYMW
ncbi:MAG: PDZ domain-containing protein [Methanocorpusculum parvum]|nr:PDZ domain-containing protein [Methanocorpusculum parvum]